MDPAADAPVSCPRCRDAGFEIVTRDGVERARPCACRRTGRAARTLEAAGIPPRYAHCEFGNFDLLSATLRAAWSFCGRFCEDYPEAEHGLLLQGPCGVGKTHLVVATLKRVVAEKGARGRFYEFNELLRRIQDSWDRRSETTELSVLDPVLETPVLVLDDLGAVRLTPWVQDTVALIINERYNARRLTLVTSNRGDLGDPGVRDGESLGDRVGLRVRSRLAEMCRTVKMQGDDYRHAFRAANDRVR